MTHNEMKAALAALRASKGEAQPDNKAGQFGQLCGRVVNRVVQTWETTNINGEAGVIDRFVTAYDYTRQVRG